MKYLYVLPDGTNREVSFSEKLCLYDLVVLDHGGETYHVIEIAKLNSDSNMLGPTHQVRLEKGKPLANTIQNTRRD